jgi:2-polyprenyl-3-methyl-5-hydroxy-6-metoxy-1,4-benzoquinol methylase
MDNKKEIIEKRYADFIPGDSERIKKIIELTGTGEKILDIGCGVGIIGEKIKAKGNIVYGIDFSKGAVKNAREKGIFAKVANIEKEIPFKNNFFDGIVLGEILEHIFDTDRFLQNVRKKLKNNGYIIITTPNLATFGRRLLLLFGKNPHIEYYFREDSAGHIRYFVKDTLFKLLFDNGFRVEKYTSDEVNFNAKGTIKSKLLCKVFPGLGRTIIVKARKIFKEK